MPKPLTDLDTGDAPVDDRWTLTRLAQAGYAPEWERVCRLCGEDIVAYRKTNLGRLLILNAGALDPHDC